MESEYFIIQKFKIFGNTSHFDAVVLFKRINSSLKVISFKILKDTAYFDLNNGKEQILNIEAINLSKKDLIISFHRNGEVHKELATIPEHLNGLILDTISEKEAELYFEACCDFSETRAILLLLI